MPIDSRLRAAERRASKSLCPECRSRPRRREVSEQELIRTLAEIQADILENESAEDLIKRAENSEEWAARYRALAAERA